MSDRVSRATDETSPPAPETVPTPTAVAARHDAAVDDPDGAVVWHREDLRIRDQPAVAAATESADVVVPLFVFDPGFYGDDGLACDARIRFLHECLFDLSDRYDTASGSPWA